MLLLNKVCRGGQKRGYAALSNIFKHSKYIKRMCITQLY